MPYMFQPKPVGLYTINGPLIIQATKTSKTLSPENYGDYSVDYGLWSVYLQFVGIFKV